MKAIGCHIYAGGFTLGVREHFEVLAHLEDGSFGVETVEKNLGIPVYQKKDGWPSFVEDVALIYCNPPCAPWSASSVGRANTWDKDPRLSCQHECFALLVEHRPKIWMLESVRGLYNRGKSLVMDFVAQARELGYCAYFVLVDAKEHGVPQNRRRFFLVLSSVEITWHPTKSPDVTAGAVLENFEDPDEGKTEIRNTVRWHGIVDQVPKGGTMKQTFMAEFPELIGVPNCGRGSFMLRRLDPDGYAQTFTGDCKTFHPEEDRFITVGEAASLSGFPDWYRFSGPVGKRYNQIARGVLPPVAEYMADMCRRAIERAWHPATLDPREVNVYRDSIEIRNV